MLRRLFLVRHGQSEGNVDKSVYLRKPDWALDLTEKGKEQCKEAAEFIEKKKINVGYIGIDSKGNYFTSDKIFIYYSPFFRAIQTTNEIVANSKKLEVLGYQEDCRIREQDWGGHIEGKVERPKESEEKEEYGSFFYRHDRGESCADVYNRIDSFIKDFDVKNLPTNTVIISHGMAIRIFLMALFRKSVQEFETWADLKNGEVLIVDFDYFGVPSFDFNCLRKKEIAHNYQCEIKIKHELS